MSQITRAAAILILSTLLVAGLEAYPLASAYGERMTELMKRFNDVMDDTLSFLDHAWEIAQGYKDPDFDYDPTQLMNYTAPKVETG